MQLQGAIKARFSAIFGVLGAMGLFACTNGRLPKTLNSAFETVEGPTVDQAAPLTIVRIVRNSFNPQSVIDIVGDGSGDIDSFCRPVTTQTPGSTTCSCLYAYRRGNSTESREVQTIYKESNLLRCKIDDIPADVSVVNINIRINTTNQRTRPYRFQMAARGSTLDLSNPANFAYVRRYECRDIVYIPYMFDDVVYDPIQTEDPKIAVPLNFYQTNPGGWIAAYVGGYGGSGVVRWTCPGNPDDPYIGTKLTIYSRDQDPSVPISEQRSVIYSPDLPETKRSLFFLARTKSGVFNVPVNAYVAPQTLSRSDGGGGPPPLGYGAAPVPAGAPGTEVCPDENTVRIPANYHWVKIWLFRASLDARKYKTSPFLMELAGRGMGCNPGMRRGPTPRPIFPQCGNSGQSIDPPSSMTSDPNSPQTVDRVLSTGMCVKVEAVPAPVPSNLYLTGTDQWRAKGLGAPNGVQNCSVSDPLGLCAGRPPMPAAAPSPVFRAPAEDQGFSGDSGRFDFLFVVTPETVTSAEMRDNRPSIQKYVPLRYLSPEDCTSLNPDDPDPRTNCIANSSRRVNYGIKLHDVGTNGDPPEGSDRPGVFPVCAIQPN